MTTRRLLSAFIFLTLILTLGLAGSALTPRLASAQGMTLDSVLDRIGQEIKQPALARQLRTLIPSYETQRVWGLATGDFTNDNYPDVALSLYNTVGPKNQVRVYLIENQNNQKLVVRYSRPITYVESPIEVGLSVENSVVTVMQKTGDQHWLQDGYSIESGDVVLVDHFETEREDVTGDAKVKQRSIGHDTYRNFETLRTKESYFTGSSGDAMFSTVYYTLPAYRRLRDIYPGYGWTLSDTTTDFLLSGLGLRRDAHDLSIRSMQAAYDDDFIYLTVRVNDDAIVGGQRAGDRVSFWFDTKYTGDRLNRDRRLLSKQGGFPTFRDKLDSLVTNVTFGLPARTGAVTDVTYSSLLPLTSLQQEGLRRVRGQMTNDTSSNGLNSGYTLRVRIPYSFLGFETNPARLYEKVATNQTNGDQEQQQQAGIGEAATLGFTTLIYDIDDAARSGEVSVVGSSKFQEGNPSTFGTLILEPSSLYYGEVHPTYLNELRSGLTNAGY